MHDDLHGGGGTVWGPHNALMKLKRLQAAFFVMRHGRSEANDRDLIVCDLEAGCSEAFGLTQEGRLQAVARAEAAAASGMLDPRTLVVSSPFSRALETAQILTRVLGAKAPRTDIRLRERDFGAFNRTSGSAGYPVVWALDLKDPTQTAFGVESAVAVLSRVTALFLELEEAAARMAFGPSPRIVAVCHGDTGQIAEMGFLRRSPACHRHLPPLEPAEIRPMVLGSPCFSQGDAVPDPGGKPGEGR